MAESRYTDYFLIMAASRYIGLLLLFAGGLLLPLPACAQPDERNVEDRIREIIEQGKVELEGTPTPEPDAAGTPAPQATSPPNSQPTPETSEAEADLRPALPELPKDPRFYKLQKWLRNHSTVHVLVNGSDPRHLARVIAGWNALRGRGHVVLREFVIVNPSEAVATLFSETPPAESVNRPAVPREIIAPARVLLEHFRRAPYYRLASLYETIAFSDTSDMVNSPVWVVKTMNGTIRFEGAVSIADSFDADGMFLERIAGGSAVERSDSGVTLDRREILRFSPEVVKAMKEKGANDSMIKQVEEAATVRDPIIYIPDGDAVPPGSDIFDYLPPCRTSQVRRESGLSNSELYFDAYIYDPENKAQAAKALALEAHPVPYILSATVNPYFDGNIFEQELLRTWNLRCLPTRARTVRVPPKLTIEFREGALAGAE